MDKRIAYFLGGVNGVGKTTILNSLLEANPNFELFKGSAKLMARLNLQPGDYTGLRALPDELKEMEVSAMMEEVLAEGKPEDSPLIIDAHYINYKRGEMRDATGPWMRHLSCLFVIEAPAEIILQRANEDLESGKRSRDFLPDNLTPEEQLFWVNNYLRVTQEKVLEVSNLYSVPWIAVENHGVSIESVVETLREYHQRIVCKSGEFKIK